MMAIVDDIEFFIVGTPAWTTEQLFSCIQLNKLKYLSCVSFYVILKRFGTSDRYARDT